MLSGDLAEIIAKTSTANKEAIRKRLSRAISPVRRVRGFFADNQAFFYLEEQYNKDFYFNALLEAFKKAAKRFYAITKAIEYHYGFLNVDHLPCYGFSPINKLLGHKRVNAVLEDLKNLNVISIDRDSYIINPKLLENSIPNYREYKAIETAKDFILVQFLNWARSIGITSFNTGTFYSEFGKFQWAFTSPSYINSLTTLRNGNVAPAFIVADILIGKDASEEDVNFFVEKIKILNAQRNISRFIPILIVDSLTPGALQFLKKNGVVLGFVNKLFGYEYSDLLKALINTITNAGAILKKNPEQYLELISKLNKLVEGKTNNLRGDLFELAVGFYHSRLCQSLDIGLLINLEGIRKEIDVFASYANEIKVAECKGYKNKVTKAEVEEWLGEKIPVIRDWILDKYVYSNKNITFEFWSTGGYEEDALEILKNASEKTKKYQIEFYGPAEIIKKAKEVRSKKFNEILKQYYFGENVF